MHSFKELGGIFLVSYFDIDSYFIQRVLNPPVPDEVLVNFHVNCDKLVFCAYVLNNLTGAPSNLVSLFGEFILLGLLAVGPHLS